VSSAEAPDVQAWKRFCRGVEALGERILADDFPRAPGDASAGIDHLADQVACWLGWSLAYADPAAPFFQRSNDLFTPWGGPNQDNVYRHARIDPRRRYRIRGRMHACQDFALTLRVGFMHMKEWGTKKAVAARELGIGPGDDFEILLGGDGSQPGWIEIPAEVTTVSLREYYVDWQPAEPAVFTIECLDDVPAPGRPEPGATAARLDHALEQVERSIVGWNEYLNERRARGSDNTFARETVAKGLSAARYAFLFWDLAPDEVLLVDSDVPEARYWGMQLSTLGWFAPVDAVHRITSINQRQATIEADGRVRFVLAHEDPGVANWLDTAGHRNGLLTYRWFWPEGDPTPTSRVVPLDGLAAALPAETPRVDAAARREEIARRKAHLAWRFRT
jgi:hypothetical protein